MTKIKMTSLMAVLEVFRDYIQILVMIYNKIGSDLHGLLKYSYVGFGFIISIGFNNLFGLSGVIEFWIYFLIQAVLLAYLIKLSYAESKKRKQGVDAITWGEKSKKEMYLARAMIFLITTLFYSISSFCLHFLYGHSRYVIDFKGQETLYGILSVILLIEVVVVVQYFFITAIRHSSPEIDKYDGTGRFQTDPKTSYYFGLKQIQSPFKAMYGEYFSTGKYYKVVMMFKKFLLLLVIVGEVNPDKKTGIYVIQYFLFWIVEALFLFYQYKTQPYFVMEYNLVVYTFTIVNVVCSMMNMILVMETNKGSGGRITIVVLQFIMNTIYSGYMVKVILMAHPKSKDITKRVFEYLDFTHIGQRGKFQVVYEKKEKYKYNLVFNKEFFDLDLECLLRIWHQYWDEQIFSQDEFKSPVPVESLPFIKILNTPPYLRNFKKTIGERHEENLRIIRYIGLDAFKEVLENQRDDNVQFFQSSTFIVGQLNGIDVYYQNSQSKSCFGKCSIFPFPFQISFSYDDCDEVIQLKTIQEFQNIIQQNETPLIKEKKNLRWSLRCLHGQRVYYYQQCRETRRKTRSRNGKSESYTVDATVEYKYCQFSVLHSVDTPVKLSNGTEVNMGPGFSVRLKYDLGEGLDDEGERYTNKGRTFKDDCLNLTSSFETTSQLTTLFTDNNQIISDRWTVVQGNFEQYRMEQVETYENKRETLSYRFMGLIYNASPEVFYDQNKIQALLQFEKNEKMHNLHETQQTLFENLYKRLAYIVKSTQNAYQYFFFLDIWENNCNVKQIKENEELLNPYLFDEKCLAYKEDMSREDLEKVLEEAKLRKPKGKGFFSNFVLDNYFEMSEFLKNDNIEKVIDQNTGLDPEQQRVNNSNLQFSRRSVSNYNKQTSQQFHKELQSSNSIIESRNLMRSQIAKQDTATIQEEELVQISISGNPQEQEQEQEQKPSAE